MKSDSNLMIAMKKKIRKREKGKNVETTMKMGWGYTNSKDDLEVAQILVDFVNLHNASTFPVLDLSQNLSGWAAGKRSAQFPRRVRRNFSDPSNLLLSSSSSAGYLGQSCSRKSSPPRSCKIAAAAGTTKVYFRKKMVMTCGEPEIVTKRIKDAQKSVVPDDAALIIDQRVVVPSSSSRYSLLPVDEAERCQASEAAVLSEYSGGKSRKQCSKVLMKDKKKHYAPSFLSMPTLIY